MVRAGQRKIVGGVLQPSKPPTEDAEGMSIRGVDVHRNSDVARIEPSFGTADSTPHVGHGGGDEHQDESSEFTQKNV